MPKLRLSPILLVMNIALVVYGLTALFSIRTAYNSSLSQGIIAAIFISIIIYFVLANQLRKLDMPLSLGMLVGAAGLIFSLFFISQFEHQQYIETPDIINRLGNLTTFLPNLNMFIHPNSAATILEVLLPIVLALLLMVRERTQRIFWMFSLLVLIYTFVLTYSRGAYLGLAAALFIGLVTIGIKRLSGKQAALLVIGMIAITAVVVGGLVLIGPRVPFVASLMGVTASRLEIYRNSLMLAGDYIFTGIGLGDTFEMVYSRYSLMIFVPQITYTHNLFLAVLLGHGIIGLVAFFIVVITFYLFVLRVLWVVRITELDPLFYGAWIGVTAALIHGLTDARQYVESPFDLPLLFIGMALTIGCGISALRAEAFENRATNRRSGWRTLSAITASAVVLLVIGFVAFNKTVLAAWHTNLGALNETRADSVIQPNLNPQIRDAYIQYARSEYEQALQIDPYFPNANRRLGNLNVDMGAFAEAVPLLEKAYAAEPNYQASVKGLGLAYTWAGRTQEAACVFKKLADVGGMNNELYTWQGYRSEQKQDLLSAYALETAAILEDYQQTNMDVWILTGDRYQVAGRPEKAQEWYSRTLGKDTNNQTAMDKLRALGLEPITVPWETGCI